MSAVPKARTQGLVVERVGDELIVYDERSQTVHALSREAAAVWEHCDGTASLADLGARVGLESPELDRALAELRACDLFEEAIAVRRGYSRREAAVKLAKIGGAAVVAPLVYSVSLASAAGCPCSLNKPGCHPDGFSLGKGAPTCSSGGVSGAKGCDCTCCSGVCYERTANDRFCASATCLPSPGTCTQDSDCCSNNCRANHTCGV